MKKTTEPTIYKFEFYAQVHPWLAEDFKKDLKEQVDEALCYVDELQQLTKIQVTEYSLKAKPVRKGGAK